MPIETHIDSALTRVERERTHVGEERQAYERFRSGVESPTADHGYFPPKSPELNPMEGCWNQVKDWYNYRLIEDLDALKQSLRDAITEIHEPVVWNYLCP